MTYLQGEYREEYDKQKERIEAWYACDHVSGGQIRRRVQRNGVESIWCQCPSCGENVGSAISKSKFTKEQLAALPLYDDALKNERYQEMRRKIAELYERLLIQQQEAQSAKSGEWWTWYKEYLTSPEWQALRDRVLRRANGRCEGCGANAPSQVHHLTYEHVGNEFLFELVAVCVACHTRLHEEQQSGAAE